MRRGECHELEVLIDREARGWSEAERLRVEQHLTSCAECSEVLAASRFVRDTLRSAQGGLSGPARERALNRAFAASKAAPVRSSGGALRIWTGGLLLSSAAAALLVWWSADRDAARAPLASHAAPAAAERFVAAETLAPALDDGKRKPAAEAVEVAAAATWIEAEAQQRHEFGHASVLLARATRARFEEPTSTLVLQNGRVEVDVDAGRGRPFRVLTQHFRVEVLGTRFTVTPRSVVVTRGHVQVFALDGRVLASDLAAGSSFSYDARRAASAQADAGVSGPGAGAGVSGPQAGAKGAPSAVESASTLLARAREALAQGELSLAFELVARAEASAPGRGERAEAGTLRAELALLGKQHAKAISLYTDVAEQFADLPAGENAAFAAARLAARSAPARERALLERYLTLHPQGRFVDEAKRRLAHLAEP